MSFIREVKGGLIYYFFPFRERSAVESRRIFIIKSARGDLQNIRNLYNRFQRHASALSPVTDIVVPSWISKQLVRKLPVSPKAEH
jgi:hypothetical protein